MPSHAYPAIVLAAYGSLYPQAMATYDLIKATYEQEFPGSPVRLAFTSQQMRQKLKEKEGIFVHSPLTTLAELHDLGHRYAIVQSLQVVPGEEFHQVASLVQALKSARGKFGFDNLKMGMPLLSSLEDCKKVSSLLPPAWNRITVNGKFREPPRYPEKEAVVLVGHGTGHPADSLYSLMAQVLQKDHRNVFMGTLEGFPGIDELIPLVKSSGAKKVMLLPFLLVVGGHAVEDMAGDGPDSWKSIFAEEGFEVEANLCGIGESEGIVALFIEHTRRALEKAQRRA